MAFIRNKAREYGQLCLLFLGFLTGIGLVVTCGGGGGSGQQLPTSTSGTISYTPLNVDGSGSLLTGPLGGPNGSVNVDVPPALRGITNVQDALNRLNVILSPILSRVTDPLTPLPARVVDANLPEFLKDSATGEPLTFSRALRGLVRASSLSGVLRADDAFLLTCREANVGEPITAVPYVQRSFCRETFDMAGNPIDGFGVIEIFDRDSIDNVGAIIDYDNNLPDAQTRVRIDGGDPVSGAPRITVFDGTPGAAVPAVILDGAAGTITAHNGAGAATVTLSGATGDVTAGGNVSAGMAVSANTSVSAGTDVTAGGHVTAGGDVTADGLGSFGTGASTVVLNNAASGNVDATGSVNAGLNVAAGGNVTAGGSVAAGTDITAGGMATIGGGGNMVTLNGAGSGDVAATGNVSGTNVNATAAVTAGSNVSAGGDVTANGAGTFGSGANTVTLNSGGTGNVTGSGSATFGGNGTFNGAGSFGTGANTVALNTTGNGEFSATGNGAVGGNLAVTGDITGNNITAAMSLITNSSMFADGNIEAGTTAGMAGTGTVLLDGATGDITANGAVNAGGNVVAGNGGATVVTLDGATGDVNAAGSVVAGNGGANSISLNAATGDVTASNGSFLAPAGTVLAGADPSAGNVGVLADGANGIVVANSAATSGRFIGNGVAAAPNVLDIFDQSVSATPTHLLVSAGEKAGAAPDGTGYLSIFDSAQVAQIVLDSETPTVTVGTGTSAIVLNSGTSTATIGSAATGIVLNGGAGTFTLGTGANQVSMNVATGITSVGTGGLAIVANSTLGTLTVGSANAVSIDGQNGTASVGAGANAITMNGTTAVLNVGSGATGIMMDGATGTFVAPNVASTGDVTAGSGGANTVVLDAATGSVTADGNVVAGNGAMTVTLDGTTGGVTAPGDIVAGSGGNAVILDAATGGVTAVGNISGDNVSATTNVTAGNNVSAGNNVTASVNVMATVDVAATNDLVSTDGRMVVQTPGAVNEVVIASADVSGHGALAINDTTGAVPLVTAGRDPGSVVDDGIVEVYQNGASIIQLVGSTGDVAGTTKSFVQPHPTDPTLMIKYRCLEGPENGLYARGTAKIVDGVGRVELPESFVLAAAKEGLSVHLTPMGDCSGLYAPKAELTREGFVVRELFNGRSTVEFSWVVNGVRRGLESHEAIVPNTAFRPTIKDKEFLPGLPGLQKIMIANGLLNADGTPNEQVAADAGMVLKTLEEIRREKDEAKAHRRR